MFSEMTSLLLFSLRGFPGIALRIPTAHDFRVISACTSARACTKRKRFPQTKLDSKINAPFLSNKHSDPHFSLHLMRTVPSITTRKINRNLWLLFRQMK